MKKLFITVFVIVICAALIFTGCSKDKNKTDTNVNDNTVTEDMNGRDVTDDTNGSDVIEDMNDATNPTDPDNMATMPPADDQTDNKAGTPGIITDDGTTDGMVQ